MVYLLIVLTKAAGCVIARSWQPPLQQRGPIIRPGPVELTLTSHHPSEPLQPDLDSCVCSICLSSVYRSGVRRSTYQYVGRVEFDRLFPVCVVGELP